MAALNYVHLILDNPNTWIAIEDHGPNIQADRHLFDLVCCVLRALGVRFEANKTKHVIQTSGAMREYQYPTVDEIREEEHQQQINQPLRNKRDLYF